MPKESSGNYRTRIQEEAELNGLVLVVAVVTIAVFFLESRFRPQRADDLL